MPARAIDIDRVTEGTMLRLDVAARLAFPDGSVGISSLRREAARGRLTIWRVAGKDMTSLAEIRSMVDRCRVQPNPPASGSDQQDRKEPHPGSSSTEAVNTALAAARMRAKKLKDGCSNTSAQSTTRPQSENVVPIKLR